MRGAVASVCFLVASCVWLAHGATDAGDVAALNALFADLDGDPALVKWVGRGGDPCGDLWLGITCVGTSVTGIKLPNLDLEGDLKGSVLVQLLHLTVLDLSFNTFDNDIPLRFPPTLVELDLSNNKFEGNFPDQLMTIPTLTSIKLNNNKLDGNLKPLPFTALVNVVTLDLSNNRFTGAIPVSIGDNMVNMKFLYLQKNKFTGSLPTSFANLVALEVCDVSDNKLTGYIPPNFKPAIFRYQGNEILEQAPPPPPFTAPPPPATRNPAAPPTDPNAAPGQTTPLAATKASSSSLASSTVAAVVVVVVLVVLAAAALLLWFLVFRKKPARGAEPLDVEANHNRGGRFCVWCSQLFSTGNEVDEKPAKVKVFDPDTTEKMTDSPRIKAQPPVKTLNVVPRVLTSEPREKVNPTAIAARAFTVAELQSATRSFAPSALLGGHVYRADFPDGRVLAVKKLADSAAGGQSEEAFLREVEGMARLRHAGVVGLVGYCAEHGQRLLVSEFVGRGTLHALLHADATSPLSWIMRVKIALGAARALEYLHEVCSPPVVHRNFSSHKILLDDEMLPHVSDCGLEALAPAASEHQASGYSAPEYTMSGTYTPKSDVYSFGVVVLELLTGRKPLDSSRPRSEQSLVRWATPQLHDIDALARMVDPALAGAYPAKSLSRLADIVALCVQPEPEFRPSMSEVVQSLVRLMQRATLSNRQTEPKSPTFKSDT